MLAHFKPSHDLSLLRPFQPGEASKGAKLLNIHPNDRQEGTFLCLSSKGHVVYEVAEIEQHVRVSMFPNDLKMPPLAWVENKPVYFDSVLCFRDGREVHFLPIQSDFSQGFLDQSGTFWEWGMVTWNKPKVMKSAWINRYTDDRISPYLHPSREKAIFAATGVNILGHRATQVEIFWWE